MDGRKWIFYDYFDYFTEKRTIAHIKDNHHFDSRLMNNDIITSNPNNIIPLFIALRKHLQATGSLEFV